MPSKLSKLKLPRSPLAPFVPGVPGAPSEPAVPAGPTAPASPFGPAGPPAPTAPRLFQVTVRSLDLQRPLVSTRTAPVFLAAQAVIGLVPPPFAPSAKAVPTSTPAARTATASVVREAWARIAMATSP